MPITEFDTFTNKLQVRLGINYTDEQIELMKDFTKSRISFSSPGTGKTRTAIGGLITAECFHGIPGDQIYALSFTNAATGEIRHRHKETCDKLHIVQRVNFSTLHSICTNIIKANYHLLGMDSISISSNYDTSTLIDLLLGTAAEWDVSITPWQARNIIMACRELNSALVFDKTHVCHKKCFMDCKMQYELFTRFRKLLYDFNKLMEKIQVSDILLYTLEILLKYPDIGKEFKKKCKVMLVDEFQDLSLLQLRIISLLADNVIAIGDIKQQIYAFNGACQEIVAQYYKYYPDAVRVDLTRSFRCQDKIADYATSLILANSVGGEDFKGTGPGGTVEFKTAYDFANIAQDVADELAQNHNNFVKNKLFLYRNNYSSVPIVEAFYNSKVPMRVDKYTLANEIPVVCDMCEVVILAQNPGRSSYALILNKLIPEFQVYKKDKNPLMKIMEKTGKNVFEINYKFKDPATGGRVMEMIMQVREMDMQGACVRDIFKIIWDVFNDTYLKDHGYMYEMEPTYYTRLVAPLIATKTFSKFISDEQKKKEVIEDSNKRAFGVRCCTFHGAKGLEADEVYIIDANASIVPNKGQLAKLIKAGCDVDVAREIRNERSLVYVACTRAKEKLVIYHNEGELSSLFTPVNEYSSYDAIYAEYRDDYSDAEVFREFVGVS